MVFSFEGSGLACGFDCAKEGLYHPALKIGESKRAYPADLITNAFDCLSFSPGSSFRSSVIDVRIPDESNEAYLNVRCLRGFQITN